MQRTRSKERTQRCALVGFPDGLAHQDRELAGVGAGRKMIFLLTFPLEPKI